MWWKDWVYTNGATACSEALVSLMLTSGDDDYRRLTHCDSASECSSRGLESWATLQSYRAPDVSSGKIREVLLLRSLNFLLDRAIHRLSRRSSGGDPHPQCRQASNCCSSCRGCPLQPTISCRRDNDRIALPSIWTRRLAAAVTSLPFVFYG